MIRELDTVVLMHDIEEYCLMKGDIGTVVHCYGDGKAYEVEFVSADGRTIAVITLSHTDIRLMDSKEILHVRKISLQAA
ncbi:MAG TPA: DUF4926 domain-containing protein [Deltaproteobacteria bacterium]|nr:MAG: DUF4926 domain-containing protein [Deltaproteobacteria bacterium GWD2_42_10]OGP48621.1 MAG: DUF4926 domain-containing protein [Deltaproteobacteria bacterium GWF2_42_12]OGQ68308.1 MAG: DUF4926 domain-containing protein [Deltaproteobacteria bacterium RIFCSPLOWO2_12_FULL_42_16]OGQ75359.1 MAG: DUF4926 domain-containing protein [Deltaproteobacteria bacterium RIFOXYA2_FULL_42_10]HAG51763.1 DUF4926 domain-containing protein [Deltaproteobacteria bacterium]